MEVWLWCLVMGSGFGDSVGVFGDGDGERIEWRFGCDVQYPP